MSNLPTTFFRFAVLGIMSSQFAYAGDLFLSRQRTQTRCSLPNHRYRPLDSEVTTEIATALAIADLASPGESARRNFHVRALKLSAGPVTLDRIGVALHKANGLPQLVATGRVTNDGGGGDLIGANAVITIRAYAAKSGTEVSTTDVGAPVAPNATGANTTSNGTQTTVVAHQVNALPNDTYMIWKSTRRLWVDRHRPNHTSLVAKTKSSANELTHHFDEITHIELQLEYLQDR